MHKLIIGSLLITISYPLYANSETKSVSSTTAIAGDSTAENKFLEMPLEDLMQVDIYSVTATKMLENINKSISTVTVIDQQQITNMGARNLLDVLKTVPGFGITQMEHGVRQIEVRGVRTSFSEKVLIMLNGHPVDSMLLSATGIFNYDNLPVGSIKRVEIVRGPGSALYGANAFLAVINIITQNAKDLNGFHISAAGGSFDTQQYLASWGKQFDNSFEAALHFNFANTNGIGSPLYTDSTRSTLGKSQLTEKRYDFEWQLGYKDFKFEGRYIDKKDGTFFGITNVLADNRSGQNFENYFLKLSRRWNITNNFTLDTQIYHDANNYAQNFLLAPNTYLFSRFQETRTGGEVQANYSISDKQSLIAGFSYAKENHDNLKDEISVNSVTFPAPHTSAEKKRNRWGVYAQDVWDPFKNLHLTLGIRYDDYSDFGGTLNPRVGFNWEFVKDYSLKFSYGTAYRAPAYGELTLQNNGTLLGNPTLTPEIAKTLEGGIVAHPVAGLTTQAIYYYTDINKIIAPVGSALPMTYQNTGHIAAQGVEGEIRYDFTGNLQGSYLSANSVWQHSIQNGRQLADVPRYRTNLMANWAIDDTWSTFAHVLVKSSTLRNSSDTRANVSGYTLVDLGVLGKNMFNKKVDIGFNIYNLFDKRYYDPAPQNLSFVGDFQAAGISFFGHVDVHF
jgi:iron complex outermembrane receptor protein